MIVILPISMSEIEFLLGLIDTNEMDFRLNFLLLFETFFIYKEKIFGEGRLNPYKFLVELKNVLWWRELYATGNIRLGTILLNGRNF